MTKVYERIKELRTKLHLSQDYVATCLGMNRATFSQLENGKSLLMISLSLAISLGFPPIQFCMGQK